MSTVVKDLGAVSAYAYAVEKGYTGTEAEFAELMADYAEVGQRAEDAADSALESKTAAQTAATTATNKASEATTAATTATTKAGEASTSASTATSAKDTAVSASQTATTKATEATTAAATATSAATTATTAKDDAVSAKTAAQTAQTGAETAAASVQSSAAQIATNAEDIGQLKSAIQQINDAVGVDLSVRREGNAQSVKSTYVNLLTGINMKAGVQYILNYTISEAISSGDTYCYFKDANGNALFLNTNLPAGSTSINRTVTPQTDLNGCYCQYYNSQNTQVVCTVVFDKASYDENNEITDLNASVLQLDTRCDNLESEQEEIIDSLTETVFNDITDDVEWEISGYYINGIIGSTTVTGSAKTSIISVNPGEKYAVTGRSNYNQKLLCVYDASNNILEAVAPTNIDTTYTRQIVTIPSSGVKIGVSYYNSAALAIFKLEKITNDFINVNAEIKKPLYGKKVAFDGDSICNGSSALDGLNGWAGRIGDSYEMDWKNYAVNGATITAGLTFPGGQNRHWVSRSIDTIYTEYPTLDYLILEGGTNDADLLKNDQTKWGAITAGYTDTYDDETFFGAVESLFSKALNYWPKVKIGFIIDMKMGYEGTTIGYANNNPRYQFFKKIIEVCDKWAVPYINLWDTCPMCPRIPSQYDNTKTAQQNIDAGSLYTDGQHLTGNGYEVVTPKILAWMKTL